MSSSSEELDDISFVDYVGSLRIPYEEIKLATNNFTDANLLPIQSPSSSSFQKRIYKGQLKQSGGQLIDIVARKFPEEQDNIVFNEVLTSYLITHKNILPVFKISGPDDSIIINKYEANESLDKHLSDSSNLTWMRRLHICVGVAHALSYIHDYDAQGDFSVIHGNIKSSKILLDENWEAKLNCFGFSMFVKKHQPHLASKYIGTLQYTDPAYVNTGCLTHKSDVFSFGVVLFEVLFGEIASVKDEDNWYFARSARLSYEKKILGDMIVVPDLLKQMNLQSLEIFSETAYYCLEEESSRRPNMAQIVEKLEASLELQQNGGTDLMNFESNTDDAPMKVNIIVHHACTAPETENDGSIFRNNLRTIEKFIIPLEVIKMATDGEDFDRRIISSKPHMMTYRGKLVYRSNDCEAFFKHWTSEQYLRQNIDMIGTEIFLVSSFHHENITPFIGYNCESSEVIIVSEYAVNGSLYLKLETQYENSYLTWTQRLKICLGAARGLKYFHAGFGEHRVIHGDFKSKNILLYDNLEAKICGFGKSFLVPRSYPDTNVYEEARGSKYYMDPIYRESRIPRVESNVYSFGVVLFEVLTGILACNHPVENERMSMINWVRHYNDETDKLVDYRIRDEIDARSLHMFKDIAYKCISFNMKDRPSMNQVIKRLEEALYIQTHGAASTVARKNQKLEDFRIPLKDINLAIGVKGPETQIGDGGFGFVYKGQLSERWQNRTVAIKCLRPDTYQGEHEFRNELNMIFNFNHENIIPFIGYCDEDSEKIIVYEYASNGSLDIHLSVKNKRSFLTWELRLKICLGAAKGIDYLHSGLGEEIRVIHRDIKSGNILLDHNFVAKVCDFGLSKSGPINQQHTQVYTYAAGTNFYMDPVYHEGGVLRKESDVYSFGVVMFELLSGMLAYHRRRLDVGKAKPLINIVRRYYDYKPDLLIDPLIRDEIDNRSFNAYREVAFQCISFNSKERPTMEMIVDRVEEALELQVTNQGDLKQKVTES